MTWDNSPGCSWTVWLEAESEACWPCLWGWTPWPEEARSGARNSPKTPPAHRRNPDRHTNTQTLIKDPDVEKSDNSSFSGVQVLASAQESLKNKPTTAVLVWKQSFIRSQVGKMTLNRCWTLTCSIGKDPTCLYAATALFSTYMFAHVSDFHTYLTLAGCQVDLLPPKYITQPILAFFLLFDLSERRYYKAKRRVWMVLTQLVKKMSL